MMQQQSKNKDFDCFQIESIFNSSSWGNVSIVEVQFTSHGVCFLADSILYYSPHPLPVGNLIFVSTLLAQDVLCFSIMENEGALYFVLILSNGDLAICVLEEMWEMNNIHLESKSSLKLRLLHAVSNLQDLNVPFQSNLETRVVFISEFNHIIFEQGGFVSILRYDADVAQDEVSVTVLLRSFSLENEHIRKLLPFSNDSYSQLFSSWKHSSGKVTLVGRMGHSSTLVMLLLSSLSGESASLVQYYSQTTHKGQITAISTSPNIACDYAITGDINGSILLWKYYISESVSKEHKSTTDIGVGGKWEIVLEENSFCEGQSVSFTFVDPRNNFAYIGDMGGRLSVAQISTKSNHMHLIHELFLFPIAHGPSTVFVIPTSELPSFSSSSASYVADELDSTCKKADEKSILVQCYCQTTGEAVQVHLNRGIACVMRVNASTVFPCDRGNTKMRSEKAHDHAVFPVQDAAPKGTAVIDRSIVLSSLGMIVTVDWLGVVQMWDITSGQLVHENLLPSHNISSLVGHDGHCWTTKKRLWLCSGHQTGTVHAVCLALDPQFSASQSTGMSLLDDKTPSMTTEKEAILTAAALANQALTGKAVFDLLQEENDVDDDAGNSSNDSGDSGSENASDLGEDSQDRGSVNKDSLLDGSIGSIGNDSLSFVSWYGAGKGDARKEGGSMSHLPLLWNVTLTARPSRLPVSDVFLSDFGEQLVTVHGKRMLHLFPIDVLETQGNGDIAVNNEAKHISADTKPPSNKTTQHPPQQQVRARSKSNASSSHHSNGKMSTDAKSKRSLTSSKTWDTTTDTDSNSDQVSLDSGIASVHPTANQALPTTAKRPLRSFTLPFQPFHITVLHKQPVIETPEPVTDKNKKKKQKDSRKNKQKAKEATEQMSKEKQNENDTWTNSDRLWLVLQKETDHIVILDALKMEMMTEVKLSPAGQDLHLRVTFVWDYVDTATLQCVLMGLCAVSPFEWFEFNEIDGLKAVLTSTGNQGGSFHQSTYSNVLSADIAGEDHNNLSPNNPPQTLTNVPSKLVSTMQSIVSHSPLSILQTELLGVETYREGEAPIVVAWSQKTCALVRVQLMETNRVAVTRVKRYDIAETGLLQATKRHRVRILTGKALSNSSKVRNHRAVVVLSNGFAIVLHL